ncbi:MAG: GNAT family N-acetyltransferase [Chloroflexota bacterium]
MMIRIRNYKEKDADEVGRLIADTYAEFNLAFASPEDRNLMLGPFRYARSADEKHQAAIAEVLRSPVILVAETGGEVVGILRGRKERLASLFVHKKQHHQGIGRRLVGAFEAEMLVQGVSVIRLAATLHAVPFYSRLGYKKSTGVRTGWSFDGYGFPYQPMKKMLRQEL